MGDEAAVVLLADQPEVPVACAPHRLEPGVGVSAPVPFRAPGGAVPAHDGTRFADRPDPVGRGAPDAAHLARHGVAGPAGAVEMDGDTGAHLAPDRPDVVGGAGPDCVQLTAGDAGVDLAPDAAVVVHHRIAD